jgi:hypothetical protein
METVFQTLQVTPLDVRVPERTKALVQCQAIILQIEASQALDSVRDVENPTFQFSHKSLARLKGLLTLIKDSTNKRISDLQYSDTELVIICGLCFTLTEVARMKDGMWGEVIRQAQLSTARLARHFAHNAQIANVINTSPNNEFKQSQYYIILIYNLANHAQSLRSYRTTTVYLVNFITSSSTMYTTSTILPQICLS